MKMNSTLILAVMVTIASFLQGWLFTVFTGYPSYMKKELNLESDLVQDSFVFAASVIGMLLAMASGRIGGIGRRPLLVISSMLYLFSSLVMLLSGDFSLILVARLLDGFAWSFSSILVPFYSMETCPGDFCRLVLHQLSVLCGMCLGMIVVVTPLTYWAAWKLMLGVAFGLSLLYFILAVFYVPESPKWLVRKGRIDEARNILQILHGRKDVSHEMFMLGYEPALDDLEYGPEDVSSDNPSKPVTLSTASQKGIIERSQNASPVDSLLTVSGNVDKDSLTREGDDSMPNAADASVLTIHISN